LLLLIWAAIAYFSVINRRGNEMTIRQKIAQFAAYQRAVRELNSLDARQLNDLGITRSDIKSAVRGKL
jgi:uncharacterized protein YjiS (DUF1127 family)